MTDRGSGTTALPTVTERARQGRPAAPAWTVRALSVSGAILALAAVGWLLSWVLLRLPLLTFTLALAVLLAALTAPVAGVLRRAGLPNALSALLAVLSVLAVLTGIGFLVGFRAAAALHDLTRPLAAGIDRIRVWLIEGPLGLDPQQVAQIRNQIVTWLYQATPSPTAGARMAVYLLATLILVAFLVFFLLKDGATMWGWLLERVPARRRGQVDGAGCEAWTCLGRYTRGAVIVAIVDAVGIGLGLFVLGVPLWLSLTLLIFLGSFVPLLGATVSGAVAVLVTLVTNGATDAIIILIVVLVVQQVEGNLLLPLVMGQAVNLHPAVILVAVTAGGLLLGIAGAVIAVPLVATIYCVLEYLRTHPAEPEPAAEAADGPRGSSGASAADLAVPSAAAEHSDHVPVGSPGSRPRSE